MLESDRAADMEHREGSSRGGAVMAYGGNHGDQRRPENFMTATRDWGNVEGRQLS